MMTVTEMSSPLFVDAFLMDGDRWVFGSFWANETTLQEFIARISTPNHELGLRSFTVTDETSGERKTIFANQINDLKKITAKTPATILGSVCNMWIFDPALHSPNHTDGEAFILGVAENDWAELHDKSWASIKELSRIPLLDHWRDQITSILEANDWLVRLDGVGVKGLKILLNADEFESIVSEKIKHFELSLSDVISIH